jgi:hypothetical protein
MAVDQFRNQVTTAANTWGVELVPHEDPKAAFPVHQELTN